MKEMDVFSREESFDSFGYTKVTLGGHSYLVDFNDENSTKKFLNFLCKTRGVTYRIFKEQTGKQNTVVYRTDQFSIAGEEDSYLHLLYTGDSSTPEQPLGCSTLSYMFVWRSDLVSLDLSHWDTSNIVELEGTFNECRKLKYLDVSTWETGNVTDIDSMFANCMSLESLDISRWNTSNLEDAQQAFWNCYALNELNLANWDVSNVTNFSRMFCGCKSLESIGVEYWNTKSAEVFECMFKGCKSLVSLDLSSWDTKNVTDLEKMFAECEKLDSLNLNGWRIKNMYNSDIFTSHVSLIF